MVCPGCLQAGRRPVMRQVEDCFTENRGQPRRRGRKHPRNTGGGLFLVQAAENCVISATPDNRVSADRDNRLAGSKRDGPVEQRA